MKKKSLLYFTVSRLLEAYRDKFPEIVQMAVRSDTLEQFKRLLRMYILQLSRSRRRALAKNQTMKVLPLHSAARRIYRMLELEGVSVRDFASGEEIRCESVKLLWHTLRKEEVGVTPDFILDWYYLFEQLHAANYGVRPAVQAENERDRWPNGVDKNIFYERSGNRNFIQQLLIKKIEGRKKMNSRYRFEDGMSLTDKQRQVRAWWFDYQFQLTMAIRSADELNYFMGMTLSHQTMRILHTAERKGIPFFVTPYYLSLLSIRPFGYDDAAIRSYILYSAELVKEFGQIRAWEKEDDVRPGESNAAGWLLPNNHSIHRRYPEVAIFIPDSKGRACGGLCAVCQRMYGFQQGRLNFDLEKLAPREDWNDRLRPLMAYFEHDSQLRDILVTGGDALMSTNVTLKKILDAILGMAQRKKEANVYRPEGQKYAVIQRVRLGSRMPAYLPYRIDNELVALLRDFRDKAKQAGIKQFIIQTHFESPLEITLEVVTALRKIQEAGWMITNQQVFTVASSRRGHSAALRRMLNRVGILSYYTFSVKGFAENRALAVPNCRLMQEMREEKIYGQLTAEVNDMLRKIAQSPENIVCDLGYLLDSCRLPFVATDRNVMNLPGIGKSMTFTTVAVLPDGRRVLYFTFDNERFHSPVVAGLEGVYITESKSVADYLRQLECLGERAENYGSVWYYNQGKTEAVADLFRYPEQENGMTKELTNFKFYGHL